MFIDVNGVRLHAVSIGSGKKTILFHGGFVVGWEMWLPLFELMSNKWRCVSYDHRGVGESPVPPESITDEAIIEDVFAVMDKLEIKKCVLVGESMGGRVAISAVLRHPERFEGLVLIGSLSHLRPPTLEDALLKEKILLKQNYNAYMNEFVKMCFPEPDCDHLHRWGLNICLRTEIEAASQYLQVFEGPDENNLEFPLSDIKIPTLVIHGGLDKLVPVEEANILASSIPDAELIVIENAGHVPPMTQPHRVVEAIEKRFIKS